MCRLLFAAPFENRLLIVDSKERLFIGRCRYCVPGSGLDLEVGYVVEEALFDGGLVIASYHFGDSAVRRL